MRGEKTKEIDRHRELKTRRALNRLENGRGLFASSQCHSLTCQQMLTNCRPELSLGRSVSNTPCHSKMSHIHAHGMGSGGSLPLSLSGFPFSRALHHTAIGRFFVPTDSSALDRAGDISPSSFRVPHGTRGSPLAREI
mmetsp:Transcript_7154/g.19608  ORF Transcript_7154/g.19608 Transcript_7154/m.19608 type:complete len:138 (+) Transcript_7154:239-652(+)